MEVHYNTEASKCAVQTYQQINKCSSTMLGDDDDNCNELTSF